MNKAETIQLGDLVMPPEREVRLWMRRHISTHNLPESALYLTVKEIGKTHDKKGQWLTFKTHYSQQWIDNAGPNARPGPWSFTFKARLGTPWTIIKSSSAKPIPVCPMCNGERELNGNGGYVCYFCGLETNQ